MKQKFYYLLIVVLSFTTYQVESHPLDLEICYEDDASFFMTPTCDGATATITGDPGGTFTFNPVPTDDVVISSVTGSVTNGTPGATYTVEYTTTGPTPETSSQSFTVLFTDDASFFMTPTCDGGFPTITGDAGGAFSFNPEPEDGAGIDVTTGTIFGGIPGETYTIEYTTWGACPESSLETFTVLSGDASFFMTPTCNGGFATITGDSGGTFNFNPTPGDGAVIDPTTGTVAAGTSGETYSVEYTTWCGDASIETFTVPIITGDASFFMTPTCDGGFATITGDSGGTFSFSSAPTDSAEIDPDTGTITGGTFGTTYFVRYVTSSGVCPDSSNELVTSDCVDPIGFIEVNAFYDENSNAVFDASETNFSQGVFTYEINNNGTIYSVYSNSGSFIIAITEEGDTYDVSFTMDANYNSCLSQTTFLVENITATDGDTVQVEFPITQLVDCNDIAVYVLSNGSPRPGVTYYIRLIVSNLGSLPVSGSVEFTHDPNLTLLDVLYVDAGNSFTNTATGFVLNFNDLQPGEGETVIVELSVPESAMAGDLVTNSVVYNVSDINLENNESTLTQVIVNSFDPNDKLESHGPEIKFEDFTNEEYLFYTINFQNLGTAEAIDIRVEDVLDGQLDVSTFKMLTASHDYVLTRTDNNLTWVFENVNLPSESMDEPNSHGYIYFKIKPVTGYGVGDIIPNTADIYFDFNPAVITNTFETEFVEFLSIDEFSTTSFSMYPNPSNTVVNIQFNQFVGENIEVGIFDIQGKLVLKGSNKIDEDKMQLDVSNLSQGMYFVELKGDDFKAIEKLIVD